ncbi:type II CRISPR RNA-guided endonuclease Cas9 [Sulfitobacter donghicola]|nr:type II CRISPR RNA-guided endonuclease Cas9 [Sulfitobacter donghicola]KIN67084.1 CRISPR-associated protein [Sulfitobacter donghicola DSW-25 = KCTC 12864 = JCM 14565]
MRLGLDIGSTSIGWWIYETTDGQITSVIDGGVRIFSDGRDPKSKGSLAVDRRVARAQRRRRDRYLRRKAALMKRMAEVGLMPSDPKQAKQLEALDPYELRARGLDETLELTELGRALFHLNQRRGFKSNRKTDAGDNESGKIIDATARLDWAMRDHRARTYGEFLHMRRQKADTPRTTPAVRTRLTIAARDGAEKEESGYDFYPDRQHLRDEFDALWEAQAEYHGVLTEDLRDEIGTIIFHQRPLKTPKVGKCLFTNEERVASAHPLNQRRILVETVNALRVAQLGEVARALTLEERDTILHALDNKAHTKSLSGMSIKLKALGKVIKLRSGQYFTLETANRDAIACDPVRASLSKPDRIGSYWSTLDHNAQWEVVNRIRAVQSDADHRELVAWLVSQHRLAAEHAEGAAYAPLPDGYSRLGITATKRILAALEANVIPYSKAVESCGWHHSDERTGEVLDRLPYYGEILDRHVIPGTYDDSDDDITRFGRITNPTVHIGLNQLRRLVNRIIEVHGKPDEIVVELARDLKLSQDQKADVERTIKKNTQAAIRRGEKLEEMGVPNTGGNRMVLRLWEDLNDDDVMKRFCPYTGQRISAGMLFDGSCDVDHILPFSRTLDDGFTNKTLCLKEANRKKRNYAPHEAAEKGLLDRDAMDSVAKYLPDNKAWRFAPDAIERFEGERDFTARALKDTQYLSRLARTYLDALYDGGDDKSHVWVVPGRLTEMLRRHWGLNGLEALADSDEKTVKRKNRTDHRHHAIDAAVVAATDRSLIQKISKIAASDEQAGAEDTLKSTPPPWDSFRDDIAAQLQNITVSHRADHGRTDSLAKGRGEDTTSGALHEATALGIIDETHVTVRIPIESLKSGHLIEGSRNGYIRDPYLRDQLTLATKNGSDKDFTTVLQKFFDRSKRYGGTRRVRIIKTLQDTARISVPHNAPIKAYKGGSNHAFEIWRLPNGKIESQVITTWEHHNLTEPKRPHPAAKRIIRLHKTDMVAIERDGKTVICFVQKTDPSNGAFLVPHFEANADGRKRKNEPVEWYQMSANSLIKADLRRVGVDEMGRVRDPGPPPIR